MVLKSIITSGSHISDSRQIDLRNDYGHCNTVTLRECLHMPLENSALTSAPHKVTWAEILIDGDISNIRSRKCVSKELSQ